jgi:hypothetical protein
MAGTGGHRSRTRILGSVQRQLLSCVDTFSANVSVSLLQLRSWLCPACVQRQEFLRGDFASGKPAQIAAAWNVVPTDLHGNRSSISSISSTQCAPQICSHNLSHGDAASVTSLCLLMKLQPCQQRCKDAEMTRFVDEGQKHDSLAVLRESLQLISNFFSKTQKESN